MLNGKMIPQRPHQNLDSSRRRSSAVSVALRTLTHAIPSRKTVPASSDLSRFQFHIANDRASRSKAYRLAHDAYAAKGLVQPKSNGMVVSPFDRHPDTLTVLAEDSQNEAAGTVSLNFDSPEGLPCDEIFSEDLRTLRLQGRRMAEVTRLVISNQHSSNRMLLVRLFNLIYIDARQNMACTDFLIEVNPRHAAYYHRLLGFEVLSEPRPCPRVLGEPAVLLRLDLTVPAQSIAQYAGNTNARNETRSLYPYFLNPNSEAKVAAAIRNQNRAMSSSDAIFFGIA